MIPFFRKIRKKMADDNRPIKYTRYAIGEIILVVIGILIALQINTWNQDRIKSAEELNILKAMKIGLEKDLSDLHYNATSIGSSMSSGKEIIYALENNLPYEDSIAYHFGNFMFPVMFVNSTSAFETLKSKGIDLISNDSLRDQIIGVYDSGYTFFIKNEKTILDEGERGLKHIFPTRFHESWVYDLEKENLGRGLVPLDFESLKSDQEFIYYIKSYKNRLNILLNFQYKLRLLISVESLLDSLEKEIEVMEE